MTKLSDDEIFAIRDVYSQGEFSKRALAEHFNVGVREITKIIAGERPAKTSNEETKNEAETQNDEQPSERQPSDDKGEYPCNVSPMEQPETPESRDQPLWTRAKNPTRQCNAHRKNGDRCTKFAILGGTVCATHGGAARHVRNAARVRLANAADRMAKELLNMATDGNVSDSVKLAAIKDALDRAGLGAKTEVEITAKPYETIFDGAARIEGGSRADFRRSVGVEDAPTPALAGSAETTDTVASDDDVDVIDAEVTSDEIDERIFRASLNPPEVDFETDLDGYGVPVITNACERGSGGTWEPQATQQGPPNPFTVAPNPADAGMMPLEDAVAAQSQTRQAARVWPVRRALPPGRSAR